MLRPVRFTVSYMAAVYEKERKDKWKRRIIQAQNIQRGSDSTENVIMNDTRLLV